MSRVKLPQRSTIIVLAAAVAVVVGIGIYSRREALFASKKIDTGPTSVIVKTETVRPDKTIADKIIQNMSIDAEKRVELLPRVTGRLLSLSVKQGDFVRKGEQVATLEHDQQNALIPVSYTHLECRRQLPLQTLYRGVHRQGQRRTLS